MTNDYEEVFNTKRAISDGLEKILYEPLPVLDKGFIRVVDYMGNDSAIVQAARVSYGKGTKHQSQDYALISYLMRNKHSSPFEMCEVKLHVKLPIFVARQWIRHRTANVNEYSARYSVLEEEFYVPEIGNIKKQSKSNKQGRGEPLKNDDAQEFIEILLQDNQRCYEHYEYFLSKEVAREISRINLPMNCYTQWYWKIDLHNLLNFINLRADKHAQYEIRQYADVLLDIVQKWVPLTYDAFSLHVKDSCTFSKNAIELLKKKIKGEAIDNEELKLSKSEFSDMMKFFEEIES